MPTGGLSDRNLRKRKKLQFPVLLRRGVRRVARCGRERKLVSAQEGSA